jgi:hypothetical protein
MAHFFPDVVPLSSNQGNIFEAVKSDLHMESEAEIKKNDLSI